MSFPKWLLTGFCALLCLLTTAVPIHAAPVQQTDGIRMDIVVGFDNLRKGQGWTPLQITVSNSGPAVEGQLTIYTGSSINSRTTLYTTPLSLPTQSNKRVFLSAHLTNNTIVVELTDGQGNIVAKLQPSRVRSIDTNALLYGVVTPNPDSLDILSRITAGRPEAAVAFLTLSDLPSDAVAWRMLDVLVLSDVDTNELSAAQRTALRSWITTGGQLVVAGGANWQKTTSALADLLPVEPTGLQSMPDLPSLSHDTGHPFRDAGPYTITTSRLRDGELLYRQDSLPILARRPHGLGNVFFLALDPQFAPLEAWSGREELWGTVARYIPHTPVWGEYFPNEDTLSSALEVFPSLTLPSAWGLFCFMLLYVVAIGPLNYAVLIWWNKREWAWVSVPLVVVLFSGIAYLIGVATLGNRALLNQMTMVYGQMGADEGRAHSALSLYSPSRTSYALQLPADVQVRPLSQPFSSSARGMTIDRDSYVTVQSNIVDVGQVLSYAANTHLPLPDVRGEVVAQSLQDGRIALDITVTNHSQLAFENGIILIDRHSIPVRSLQPGETATHSYTVPRGPAAENVLRVLSGFHPSELATSASSDGPLQSYYTHLIGSSASYFYYSYEDDPVAYSRARFLDGLRDSYSGVGTGKFPLGTVTFIGWTNTAALDIQLVNGRVTTNDTTLYFLEIPFRP